jgi:redox-sensitive bicupin YhaK (pirin superfamily)
MPGNFRGVKGAARTFTPVDLWDVEIKTLNKAFELDLTDGHNCIVFVRNGRRRARVRACAWSHARATVAAVRVCVPAPGRMRVRPARVRPWCV